MPSTTILALEIQLGSKLMMLVNIAAALAFVLLRITANGASEVEEVFFFLGESLKATRNQAHIFLVDVQAHYNMVTQRLTKVNY
jgi:hypothetical protein